MPIARSKADERSGDVVKGRSQKIIRRKFNFRSASFSCKNKNMRARGHYRGGAFVVDCIGARACYWQFTGMAESALDHPWKGGLKLAQPDLKRRMAT